MKNKYNRVQLYATQGGGTAIREGDQYFFHDIPDWSDFVPGQEVPEDWGLQPIHCLYQLAPKAERKVESRNRTEGSYQKRHSYWNRKHKVQRVQKKKAKLAMKETLRSISRARVESVFHMVGVNMAKEERRRKKQLGLPMLYYIGDQLRVVNINACDEGLRLNEICVVAEQNLRADFVVVRIRRNGKLKQLLKTRFILHKRFIENE